MSWGLWLSCRFRSPLCPPNRATIPTGFVVREITADELQARLQRTKHGDQAKTQQETRTEADAGQEVLSKA